MGRGEGGGCTRALYPIRPGSQPAPVTTFVRVYAQLFSLPDFSSLPPPPVTQSHHRPLSTTHNIAKTRYILGHGPEFVFLCYNTQHTHTQTHKSPQVSSSLLHSKNHLVQALSTPLILPSFFLTGRTRPKSLDWPPVKAGQCAETPCNPSSALALGTHGLATGDCLCPALPPLCVCVRA